MIQDLYTFPVILRYEEEGEYPFFIQIRFPDFPKQTPHYHEDSKHGLEEARRRLGEYLYWMEKAGVEIPTPTPLEDVELTVHEKVTLVTVDLPPFRRLEERMLAQITKRFGSKGKVRHFYHVSPYYKWVRDQKNQLWVVDLQRDHKVSYFPLEELKCCDKFDFMVEGDYSADPIWCNLCYGNLAMESYPLSKPLFDDAFQWSLAYGEWLEPALLHQGVERVEAYDLQGLELTKRIRKELSEAFGEQVTVVFNPTD